MIPYTLCLYFEDVFLYYENTIRASGKRGTEDNSKIIFLISQQKDML